MAIQVDTPTARAQTPQTEDVPVSSTPNALDDAISEAREWKHLASYLQGSRISLANAFQPIDSDDEETDAEPDSNDSEYHHKRRYIPGKSKRKGTASEVANQDTFLCMQKSLGNGEESNANSRTIEVLLEMAGYYERVRDTWRSLAYRRACNTLRRQAQQIKFAEDAVALPFIGERCVIVHTEA
jgi:hypothetical protein